MHALARKLALLAVTIAHRAACRASPCCLLAGTAAAAATCNGPPRKINVGVSVSPPNVVHTTAYVAKELGLFAKHCLDANIIQFDGGSSPAASVALTQGNTFATVSDVQVGRGMKVKQVWGLAPKAPQAYVVSEGIKGFGDLKGKRLSAAGGGVGSFNWRIGREALSKAGLSRRQRAVHLAGHRRAARRAGRRPDRRGRRSIRRTPISR